MKKLILAAALLGFVVACGKPMSKDVAQKVADDIMALAKEQNKGCTSGFMNKEITEKALQKNNASTRSWAKFLQSEEGKTFLQDVLKNCMLAPKDDKKDEKKK